MRPFRPVLACLLVVLLSGSAAAQLTNPIPQGPLTVHLRQVATFPTSASGAPVDLAHANDGSGRIFIAGQGFGTSASVYVLRNGALDTANPFLTVNNLITL